MYSQRLKSSFTFLYISEKKVLPLRFSDSHLSMNLHVLECPEHDFQKCVGNLIFAAVVARKSLKKQCLVEARHNLVYIKF